MHNNKKNEELQSRREFFKKAAKGVLPILGAIVLVTSPAIVKAAETPMGCHGMSCVGTCYGGCTGGCSKSCMGSCDGSCRGGCQGGCQNSCYQACTSCTGSCQNSCYGAGY